MELELYRLSVLERIGREEGSQVVIYGMGADADRGQQIAYSAVGVRAGMGKRRPAPPPAPAPPPEG